jgi:hypothetical protein
MVKTLVSLTSRQMELLTSESEKLQIPKSEYLRRVLDKYFDSGKKITAKEIKAQSKNKED